MIIITENSNYFKKGQLLETYEIVEEGIHVKGHFLDKSKFINLNEALTPADEKRIRMIIRSQLKYLFYQSFTKSSILLGTI